MRLYRMELYKLVHKKIFMISLIVVVGLLGMFFWFVEVGEELSVVNGKTYQGYEAVQKNRAITEEFAGVITEDKIERIVDKYGLPSKLVENLPGWGDGNYLNSFVTRYFTNGSFEQSVLPTERYTLAESELGKVCDICQTTPVLAYTKGWNVFEEVFHFGLMMGSVLILCGISGAFADEGTTKMMPLIGTTKEGPRKDVTAKFAAAFTLTLLIFGGIVLLDFWMCDMVYGLEGAHNIAGIVLSGNVEMPLYQQDFSEYLIIIFLLGAQGLLSMCAITLCVSARNHSSHAAVVVAAAVWVIPIVLRILCRGPIGLLIYAAPIFMIMYGMLPDIYSFWYIIMLISLVIGTGSAILGYQTLHQM